MIEVRLGGLESDYQVPGAWLDVNQGQQQMLDAFQRIEINHNENKSIRGKCVQIL